MQTPFLFRKILGFSRLDIQKPTVEGIENLPLIPCIISTTHLSDVDVQEILLTVAEKRKVGMICQQTNLKPFLLKLFIAIMGRNNFFTITNIIEEGKSIFSLKIEDLRVMKKGIIKEGRTMIVAAHNPVHDWKLPQKPGVCAVILAHMTNVLIVPAVLNIDSSTPVGITENIKTKIINFIKMKRPKAKIYFCKPFQVSKIVNDKLMLAVNLYNRIEREKMSPKELAIANATLKIIKDEASKVMMLLSSKLPPEKRGEWSNFSQ